MHDLKYFLKDIKEISHREENWGFRRLVWEGDLHFSYFKIYCLKCLILCMPHGCLWAAGSLHACTQLG